LKSWQILKIWGIPLKIHPNWLILLFLFTWSISTQVNLTSSEIFNRKESLLIGFISSFLLLSSIIFHQIVHTFVCLREGVKIKNITFFFLGAILKTEKDCQNALGNIKISLVRPAFCFITSLVFYILISYSSASKETILFNIFSNVGVFNLLLGLLNLIPVGSLDGGILFQSIVWYFSGSKSKGRNLLNRITFISSVFVLIIGVLLLLNISFYYGFIISLLGLLGINSSKSESQFFRIESILKEDNVAQLKLIPLRKIEFDLNIREFNKSIINKGSNTDYYYFITKNGRWNGFLTLDSLKDIPIKKWEKTIVGQIKKTINEFPSCEENDPLWQIIEKIEKTNDGILLVVNSLGIPKGLIDRNKIGIHVLRKLGLNLSSEIIQKIKTKKNYPLGIELPRIIEAMKNKGDLNK